MLQVVQYQKTGEILIEEFPAPSCPEGGILVQTSYSLISAGTERTSVANTKASLLERARNQPDQVKLVVDNIKKEGIISTFKRVKSKLDSFKTLGYSASGIVIESDCDNFAVGDRVAAAGAGLASHAEIIAIPKNLACKIPDNVSMEDASYTTVGTIALQGVRQSEAVLGETIAVIGLGLIGQITVQLLKATGCRVIGLDINESLFDKAKSYGCDACYPSNSESINGIMAFSRGLGCDAVIITASTDSNGPMELALKIARKKGRVVVVGAVGMNLPRSPFYEKELDIKISCSYGPGRYDTDYEQRGQDYPPAYVRWTENRNMQSFLDLIAMGKLDIKSMTTHIFDIAEAKKPYELISSDSTEPYLGILLKYSERNEKSKKVVTLSSTSGATGNIKLGFIGAGSFAQSYLLPNLKKEGIEFVGVSTESSTDAVTVGKQFGFKICTTDSSELIKSKDTNLIFIATRHDTHAKFLLEAIEAGKPVYVEKPLAINEEQLDLIIKKAGEKQAKIMVGYNRRFSKAFNLISDFYKERTEPMSILFRVSAGRLPKSHWVFTKENGGRVIGEVCHFIDCMAYLTKSLPNKIYAESISTSDINASNHDNLTITLKFNDGSIGAIQYFANGDNKVPKEYCEVYCQLDTAIMNNYNSVELFRAGKVKKYSLDGKKGHAEEIQSVIQSIRLGKPMPIPFDVIATVTKATFAIEKSLITGEPVNL